MKPITEALLIQYGFELIDNVKKSEIKTYIKGKFVVEINPDDSFNYINMGLVQLGEM